MEVELLPDSVRYVKNGRGGQWWNVAKMNAQVHLGWSNIPDELLLFPDLSKLEKQTRETFGEKRGATQDFNQLKNLLEAPSSHIWVTFEDGYMWWCTVRDGAIINPDGESREKGNFWLQCQRPWSNKSIKDKLLAISDLPGTVTKTAGFKGTVCTPMEWESFLRIIQDEKDPCVRRAEEARNQYKQAILEMVKKLSPKDFEQLIDLVLFRSGWVRICTLGGPTEGIDAEVENLAASEIAFVQIKSSATQSIFDEYIARFESRRERYARMIFAVHSQVGKLIPPANNSMVQLWNGDCVAGLVVRLGLGEWVQDRIA